MTNQELRPYAELYTSSRYMGADHIFRTFYKLPSETIVPLSIAHGVDIGHCHRPMEVNGVEPIHWACNPQTHREASRYKPALLLPHPWAMETQRRSFSGGSGVLVIGPPPSPVNDAALLELIRRDVGSDWAILVKARGPYRESMRFWEHHGMRPLTASVPDIDFYPRLLDLLSSFHTVVGCTFSSALVFAASIGKQVKLIQGYTFQAYDTVHYEREVNLSSVRAREIVRTFAKGDTAASTQLSRELLGFDQLDAREAAVEQFRESVSSLRRPFWNDPKLRVPYFVREKAAMWLKKPRILTSAPEDYVRHFRRATTCIMYMNDIDVWLNGKSERNFRQEPVQFVPGVTEPGMAPGAYA